MRALDRFFTTRHPWLALAVTVAALALAPFAWRVDTDPALPSYFAREGQIRRGVEMFDQAGGTSPLEMVVRDARGGALDDDESFARLAALQRDFEDDPAVGSVLSIAVLMEETEERWYSFLLTWEWRFELLEKPALGRIGRTFIDEDRTSGRFILRMHELGREEPREEVVARLVAQARERGFEVEAVAGLYQLQGALARLVEQGVLRGLGGLVVLFFGITLVTSRSLWTSLAMTFCLLLVPFALFGLVGLAGMPLDIIAAPAANVALPMGIDEMIHLGYAIRRARRRGGAGDRSWAVWKRALGELWAPILASVLIVASGFALFTLSRFPPTQRLGVLVSAGGVLTDAVVLLVLPVVATLWWRRVRGEAARDEGDGSG